jgi:hypothetical protein
MNQCEEVCDNAYLKEHLRVTKEQTGNSPDKNTLKLIKGDCMRKICNPGCKAKFKYPGIINSFHSDYTKKERKHLKDLGVLSWCHSKPLKWGNVKPFNVMNLSNKNNIKGGKYKKNKTKKQMKKKKNM